VRALSVVLVGAVFAAPSSAAAEQGINSFTTSLTGADAGSHPDLTAKVKVNTTVPGGLIADGTLGSIAVSLPPGLVGNPHAAATCPNVDLGPSGPAVAAACPSQSQVGTFAAWISGSPLGEEPLTSGGVFNLAPGPGEAGRLILAAPNSSTMLVTLGARTSTDYGLQGLVPEAEGLSPLREVSITLWGVPVAHTRGGFFNQNGIIKPALPPDQPGEVRKPFLRAPTVCDGPKATGLDVTFNGDLGIHHVVSSSQPTPTNCQDVPFGASLDLQPTSTAVGSASGLNLDLSVPQNEDPNGVATSDLRDAVVALPQGLSLNPAAADGLKACSEQQIGLLGTEFGYPNPIHFSEAEQSCPEASKIGTAEVDSTPLPGPLQGSIYLAKQDENPFGSLAAIYVALKGYGLNLKLAGEVELDPWTGQVTAAIKDGPQLPIEDFKLRFKAGSRGILAMPETCGAFRAEALLSPWSGSAPVAPGSEFSVSQGAGGGPCAATPQARPFALGLAAGAETPRAGADSPFLLEVTRRDGEQELSSLDVTLPKGLAASLRGVPYCPVDQVGPSCPAASQIGIVTAAVGAGEAPLYVGGKAYLSGPYKGAPLSLVFAIPAVAGPLDLGNVVIRAALRINPETAQVTIQSDPIPQILKGVPLRIRSIAVRIDRPHFTRNPTGCEPSAVDATATGASGAVSSPSDRFQAEGCAALGFQPRLSLRFSGPTHRSAHPKVRAVLATREGDSNLRRLALTLPGTEFLDNAHIQTICTRARYTAHDCPAGSVYGYAKAWSPLLDEPLQGPVYLRSSNHQLPDLVASLDGQIHVDLVGRIDSAHSRLRGSFEMLPDAPVSKFELTLQGGRKGLLANNTDLCKARPRARALLRAQSGKFLELNPMVRVDCGEKRSRLLVRAVLLNSW